MKKSSFLAASVAAATATVVSASSSSSTFSCNSNFQVSHEEEKKSHDSSQRSVSTDKFAPRFDGLRFIETLITGHR